LIGQRPGDTATAYKGATCATAPPDAEIAGMAEQVACTKLTGTAVVFYVARFTSSTSVTAYLDALATSSKYDASFWTVDGERRGRLVTSPTSAGFADVTSSICAMPTYLIQFYAPPSAGLTEAQLESTYWKNATFPDTTPAVCS